MDGGSLSARGRGRAAETGPGRGFSAANSPGGGAGYGGAGSDACCCFDDDPDGGVAYGTTESLSLFMGSGGGNALDSSAQLLRVGGSGGGVVSVTANVVKITRGGSLDARGADGDSIQWDDWGSGGGSGGTVAVVANEFQYLLGGGTLDARGGHSTVDNSLVGSKAGSGGGGRIYVISQTPVPLNVDMLVDGGHSFCGKGGHGSVLLQIAHKVCTREAVGDFTCDCEPGFEGDDCDVCSAGGWGPDCTFACPECGVHGTCSLQTFGNGCTCDEGWAGDLCDTCAEGYYGADCDRCIWCGTNGRCNSGIDGNGDCLCQDGWVTAPVCDECAEGRYGPDCQQECDPDCDAHGTCQDGLAGDGACVCDEGWDSDDCTVCAAGYYGDECDSSCGDCGANAFCDDGRDGSGCTCDNGWVVPDGQSTCVDCEPGRYGPDCATLCPSCANGSCSDGVGGSGRCVCDDGYYGVLCDEECPDCANGSCDDGREGSGLCLCDPGWDGPLCNVCDEDAGYYGPTCEDSCGHCGPNAFCQAGLTGEGCVCDEGWAVPDGDDECVQCAALRFGPTCSPCPNCGNGTCHEFVDGDGECTCHAGSWGRRCDNPCPACVHGTCDSQTGECACEHGWAGELCDECAPTFYGLECDQQCPYCGPHATCDDGLRGGGCVCDEGWTRVSGEDFCTRCAVGYYGRQCRPCPDCVNGDCDSGIEGSGLCECAVGWAGKLCDTCRTLFFGDDCSGVCPDCSAYQSCNDGPDGDGRCKCPSSWSGERCDICPQEYSGTQCDRCAAGRYGYPVCDECECAPGIDCDDDSGECICPTGYNGDDCGQCDSGRYSALCLSCPPCEPGAECEDGVGGSGACVCPSGYDGVSCDLAAPSEVCTSSSEGTGNGGANCIPGSLTLERGFDLAKGEFAHRRIFAAGIGTGPGEPREVSFGGVTFAVPRHARFEELDASDEEADVTVPTTLLGSSEDVRRWVTKARLGLRVESPDGLSFGASGLPSTAAVGRRDLRDAAEPMLDGQFMAATMHRRGAFRLVNDYVAPPPATASAIIGAVAAGAGEGLLATLDDVAQRFVSRSSQVSLVGSGVGSGVGAGGAGLRTTVGFRKAVASLPRDLPPLDGSVELSAADQLAVDAYQSFITSYGTHAVRSALAGGYVESIATATLCPKFGKLRTDEVAVDHVSGNLESTLADSRLDVGDLAAVPRPDSQGRFADMEASRTIVGGSAEAFISPGGTLEAWKETVYSSPEVIGLELVPLPDILSDPRIACNLRRAIAAHVDAVDAAAPPSIVAVPGPEIITVDGEDRIAEERCTPLEERGTLFFVSGASRARADVVGCALVAAGVSLAVVLLPKRLLQ